MWKGKEPKCDRNLSMSLCPRSFIAHTACSDYECLCVFCCLFIRLLFTFFPPVFNVILAWVLLGSFFHCIKHLRCVRCVYFDLFCVFSQHVSFACTFSLSLTEAAFTQREHNERNIHMEISQLQKLLSNSNIFETNVKMLNFWFSHLFCGIFNVYPHFPLLINRPIVGRSKEPPPIPNVMYA